MTFMFCVKLVECWRLDNVPDLDTLVGGFAITVASLFIIMLQIIQKKTSHDIPCEFTAFEDKCHGCNNS